MIYTIAPKHDYDNSLQTRDYTLVLGNDYDENYSSQTADYTVDNSARIFNMTNVWLMLHAASALFWYL